MYEFAEDAGDMERSKYFGFSKDLYHFDHFLGGFTNFLPGLVNLHDYCIRDVQPCADGTCKVSVEVWSSSGEGVSSTFVFLLTTRRLGRKKGAWMTKSLLPET